MKNGPFRVFNQNEGIYFIDLITLQENGAAHLWVSLTNGDCGFNLINRDVYLTSDGAKSKYLLPKITFFATMKKLMC